MASKLSAFLGELKRRKVHRVAATYVVVAAGTIGFADAGFGDAFDPFRWPALAIAVIGFPIALVLAWAYEVRRERPGASSSSPTVRSAEAPKSIVVLPFDNMSPDPSDAYFSDGLTEEIITNLSHIGSLRVISRSSAMVLKGTQKDVRTIGRELGVEYVLEGSVRKAGDNLRITAQLIDAATDHHVWAEQYDGILDDVFSIQERVAHSIAGELRLTLNAEEQRKLADRPIADLRAYELYLKARAGILSFDQATMEKAERLLKEAMEITGENAALAFQLAHLRYQFWNLGMRVDEENLRVAQDYASRGMAVNPDSPDLLVIRGLLDVTGGNAVSGWRLIERAIELDPNHREALFWSPAISGFFGRDMEAKERWDQFRRIDPLCPQILLFPIWFEIKVGRFASALDLALRAREEVKRDPLLELAYGISLFETGHLQEAVRVLRDGAGSQQDQLARTIRTLASSLEGDREAVLALFDDDFKRWAKKDFQYSEWAAKALAPVGELEQALDWLENSVERGNINHPYLSEYDSFLANLRGHPRFEALMERVKNEWEEFEAAGRST
jgi:TolB-like protein